MHPTQLRPTKTMSPQPPNVTTVLKAVTRERLFDLARVFGARLRATRNGKEALVQALATFLENNRLPDVLRELGRDELRSVCRAHSLPADDPAREGLIARLLDEAGLAAAPPPEPPARMSRDGVPQAGQVLIARGRQWLVEEVSNGEPRQSPLLRLSTTTRPDGAWSCSGTWNSGPASWHRRRRDSATQNGSIHPRISGPTCTPSSGAP